MTVETVSENQYFGGVQGIYSHASQQLGCTMRFSYDDCPAGIVSPAILKAGKSSKTQPFFNVS